VSAGQWMTIRAAWDDALYGTAGFYATNQPRDHFRTSVHASPLFAEALLTYARTAELTTVVDLGAGGGELLTQLRGLDPDLALLGIDLRERPDGLAAGIEWCRLGANEGWSDVIAAVSTSALVLANEVLDNLACDVVERDRHGVVRYVEVDRDSGTQRLGAPVTVADLTWLDTWWALGEEGDRAEIGTPREQRWAEVCQALSSGRCVAIDYGHVQGARPATGTLSSYRSGRQFAASFDGAHDVTAHVAIDALAEAVDGEAHQQGAILRRLGVTGARPDLALASSAPADYVRSLARASAAAELTASPGLGDFWWVATTRGRPATDTPPAAGRG
jgi:SAM-dependent MidA family methyltransferase